MSSKINKLLLQINEKKELQLKGLDNPEDILYQTKVSLGDTLVDANDNLFTDVVGLDGKLAKFSEDGKKVTIYESDPSSDFSIMVFSRDEMRVIADMFRKIR